MYWDYLFVGALFLISIVYLYRTFFKKKGCASCPTDSSESRSACGCSGSSSSSASSGCCGTSDNK